MRLLSVALILCAAPTNNSHITFAPANVLLRHEFVTNFYILLLHFEQGVLDINLDENVHKIEVE